MHHLHRTLDLAAVYLSTRTPLLHSQTAYGPDPFVHALDGFAFHAGLQPLREVYGVALRHDVRVWIGRGLEGVHLFAFTRSSFGTSLTHVYPVDREYLHREGVAEGPAAERIWRALSDSGLEALERRPARVAPSALEFGAYSAAIEWWDGEHYVMAIVEQPDISCTAAERRIVAVINAIPTGEAVSCSPA